ncbi:MAG: putative baseplate assembly protein [Chloroflexi bacterium]|nr:MAG: putative baseplate assembly protein [Chloroflexota bacterium]
MPLELPIIDDRNYEQLLDEAKRRIPAHTPEWTNYNVESDPGITIVQLFAFLTDSLIYRSGRIPELNRLKFLQILGIPLQPPTASSGFIVIQKDRGSLDALQLDKGIEVAAGKTNFITRDPVTVLPLAAQVYYKRPISIQDERYKDYEFRYEALLTAMRVANESSESSTNPSGKPAFYETAVMTQPSIGNPDPMIDITADTVDGALYIALLAPKNVEPTQVREKIADKTLSIGIVPALSNAIPALQPAGRTAVREKMPELIFEIPNVDENAIEVTAEMSANYSRLPVQQPNVLTDNGIVKVILPELKKLNTWEFPEPMQEGSGDFPPMIEDLEVQDRLVTWIRMRIKQEETESAQRGTVQARLAWMDINAARVTHAVSVKNELLGWGNGEPDQSLLLSQTPVVASSLRLEVEDDNNSWQLWRMVDDLLTADFTDQVFTLDPESGKIQFGNGIPHGVRPKRGRRIRASYEYGGGTEGNVAIGAINKSADVRLQSGFKISNPLPTTGGDDGETAVAGEQRIPAQLRHRERPVTKQDFRDIAKQTPGVDVARIEILPLFDPFNPETEKPGAVTVMVIPRVDGKRPLWPTPDRLFLSTICNYLDERRLITTEIHILGPAYVAVNISVGIVIQDGHYRDDVIDAVNKRLNTYLSAIRPGGRDEEGWPLNWRLLKKDLEAVATRVAGVAYVDSILMGVESTVDRDYYDFSGIQLPLLAELAVREGEAESLADIVGGGDGSGGGTPARPIPIPIIRSKC